MITRRSPMLGELHRIVTEIVENLSQPGGIGENRGGQRWYVVDTEAQISLFHLGLNAAEKFCQLANKIDLECSSISRRSASICREVQDIVDQHPQMLAVGNDGANRLYPLFHALPTLKCRLG